MAYEDEDPTCEGCLSPMTLVSGHRAPRTLDEAFANYDADEIEDAMHLNLMVGDWPLTAAVSRHA